MPTAVSRISHEAVDARGRVRDRDPEPSWLAAVQITYPDLSALQEDILKILKRLGPLTDDEIFAEYQNTNRPRRTAQRLRSARNEMVTEISPPLVREHGTTGLSALGRVASRWEVAL